ncbi:acetyl-CoA carboxylase biotin carboxyl carrier protein [Pantoea cypripedii]|uniref:Acetyl-CoA carboxylase biotin carboxyl carrier protein subunit n=1 Tax=Pantoea cypripedii TaxID=55209 RepID=A0A1X1EQD5_PANCY|nr:acetyl-CoA carboxylase biotin carboxyl carrier protein subunit [Pantoea cypripedii]MBP2196190.1 acetyl-CoA carboxylase biotin carboxyl carrier protein [Pantoea cypripedii]ORM92147.1 acetyl-CoA carboxylase biotin carboxyl carrier protein subunit [Pantoea cypripedii]
MEKTAIPLPTLRAIARRMRRSGLSRLELGGKDWSVRLTFAPLPPAPPPAPKPLPSSTHAVTATMPGTLLLRHPLSQQDFVQPGQQVQPEEVLALVQVGPLYLPVTSTSAGRVENVTVGGGSPVEYNQEIMIIHQDNPALPRL